MQKKITFRQAFDQNPIHKKIFIVLCLFCFLIKLPFLTNPKEFYFDEVYHAFTAKLFLHLNIDAFNPWAKSPENVAIEWTHPPLAKTMMAFFMAIFGENSFGWRIGSVIFGSLASIMTALLAFELFSSTLVCLFTLFFMSFEGLVFAQSRIAMNDSYFIFFMISAFYFYALFWKNQNTNEDQKTPWKNLMVLLSGLSMGLALSTKWTGLYAIAILAFDFLFFRKKKWIDALSILLIYGLLVLVTYIASYGQLFFYLFKKPDLPGFMTLQSQMWYYHTQLTGTHSYTSKPWQWILNLKPVWMSVDYSIQDKVGHLYNLGNSIVLWGGLYAVFLAILVPTQLSIHRNALKPQRRLLLLAYFMMWVPWIFSPRIMLFYHYLPAVPFLCILLGRWIETLYLNKSTKFVYFFTSMTATWFMITYPLLTRIPISKSIADRIYNFFL